MASVLLENVSKTYDNGFEAIKGIDLEVEDGEFLVLVGPSGCGKSTLLRMIAGLEEISTGQLSIGPTIVNGLSPKERDIAMVFQNYALYPHKTVRKNIGFSLKMAKVPKAEINQQVERAAELLELTDLLDRKPGMLSGGQRQRVAMGRAIVREPAAFLMDEPLSNLDAQLRVQMRAEVAQLQRQIGTTTIYVTHDQVEAMTMGSKVAVLRDGLLQQVDTPQNLYDHPANAFVASFIGSPSMNLYSGRIDPARSALVIGDQALPLNPPGSSGKNADLTRHAGDVVIGIRPENFEEKRGHDDPRPSLRMKVNVIEALGAELIVHGFLDGQLRANSDQPGLVRPNSIGSPSSVARLSPKSSVKVGDIIDLAVVVDEMQFFDSQSGSSLRVSVP